MSFFSKYEKHNNKQQATTITTTMFSFVRMISQVIVSFALFIVKMMLFGVLFAVVETALDIYGREYTDLRDPLFMRMILSGILTIILMVVFEFTVTHFSHNIYDMIYFADEKEDEVEYDEFEDEDDEDDDDDEEDEDDDEDEDYVDEDYEEELKKKNKKIKKVYKKIELEFEIEVDRNNPNEIKIEVDLKRKKRS